jgi:hypothetical protein
MGRGGHEITNETPRDFTSFTQQDSECKTVLHL